ncbi:MAG TPA: hypothetical protein VMS86_15525 [Thermoanaerobaculia bacterium]|nr:hypothetical protein [Thermoanaerobaculia bacterium]
MRPDPGIALRLLRVALAATLLAASSFHFHTGEPASGHWDASERELVRSAASHPGAPLHMERVDVERAPRCQVCLLRDKTPATRPGLASLESVDSPAATFATASAAAPIGRAGDPGRPRGPPLL